MLLDSFPKRLFLLRELNPCRRHCTTSKLFYHRQQWNSNEGSANTKRLSSMSMIATTLLVMFDSDDYCYGKMEEGKSEQRILRMTPIMGKSFVDWILWTLKPHISLFTATIMALVGSALSSLAMPFCISSIIDAIVKAKENPVNILSLMQQPLWRLLVANILNASLTMASVALLHRLANSLSLRLRLAIFSSYLAGVIDKTQESMERLPSHVLQYLTTDIYAAKQAFKQSLDLITKSTVQTLGCAIHLYFISPTLTSFLAMTVPILMTVGTFYGKFLQGMAKDVRKEEGLVVADISNVLDNRQTIMAYGRKDFETERLNDLLSTLRARSDSMGLWISGLQFLTTAAVGLSMTFVLGAGGVSVDQGLISPGDLVAFIMASQMAQRALTQLGSFQTHIIKLNGSLERLFQTIREEALCLPREKHGDGLTNPPMVVFENVSFTYPSRPQYAILKNFNLKLEAGKVTALVGPSGSGKTTIAALLAQIHIPDSGRIYTDQKSRSYQVALISQEPFLFNRSIKENISYGRPNCEKFSEIVHASRLANADEFIQKLPSQYETRIDTTNLSGGQKQRIALARVIHAHNPILILDEPTSALDSRSEKLVLQAAFDSAFKNRTVLLIAHRMETVRRADWIVVLGAQGKILQQGRHEDLIKDESGPYYELCHAHSLDL